MFKILLPNARNWIDLDDAEIENTSDFLAHMDYIARAYGEPISRDNIKFECDIEYVQNIIDECLPHTKNVKMFFRCIYSILENKRLGNDVDYELGMISMLDERRKIWRD